MSGDTPAAPARPRRQGFWLTVSEIVGVLALVIAGLNFWEGHQQHLEQARRDQAQSQAAVAFIAVGEVEGDGHTLALRPLKPVQAIQSQRYRFPDEVLGHPQEVSAGRPRIDIDWVAGGLKRALDSAKAPASGSGRVPLVIETTDVEDGDTRADTSIYDLGFSWKRGFFGGWALRLEGLALVHRAVNGDAHASAERRWAGAKAAL